MIWNLECRPTRLGIIGSEIVDLQGKQTALFDERPSYMQSTEWVIRFWALDRMKAYIETQEKAPVPEAECTNLIAGRYLHEQDRFEVLIGCGTDQLALLRSTAEQFLNSPSIRYLLTLYGALHLNGRPSEPGRPDADDLEAGSWLLFDDQLQLELLVQE